MYGWSMPLPADAQMAEAGAAAIGTAIRESTVRALAGKGASVAPTC
jgi:hypothetical protein